MGYSRKLGPPIVAASIATLVLSNFATLLLVSRNASYNLALFQAVWPILLTSSAMILGVLVLFRDPLFIGLASSLLFGTIASTVLTLLVLPPLYYRLAQSRPEWVQARGSDATEARAPA